MNLGAVLCGSSVFCPFVIKIKGSWRAVWFDVVPQILSFLSDLGVYPTYAVLVHGLWVSSNGGWCLTELWILLGRRVLWCRLFRPWSLSCDFGGLQRRARAWASTDGFCGTPVFWMRFHLLR